MIEDTFDVGSGKSLRFGDSLEISFEAGSCVDGRSPGSRAQGIAELQLLPLKERGFIRLFRSTVAKRKPAWDKVADILSGYLRMIKVITCR